MSAGKILNTGNALYANITRALSLDTVLPQLRALDGGLDAPLISSIATSPTSQTWTSTQGITRNSTNWFGFNNFSIDKYDLNNNLLETNNSPFATLDPSLNHVGDGFSDENFVYAALSNYLSNSATVKGIAKYNVSDLSLDSYFDLDAQTMLNASGCCLSIDGTEILVTSYFREVSDDERLRDIYRINKSTGAFIGIYTLNYQVTGIQSITTDGTDYYLGAWRREAPDSSSIYRFNSSFEIISIVDPSEDKVEMEGVEYYGGTLYFNKKEQPPRVLDYGAGYDVNTTVSNQPIEFLGGNLVTDQNTILIKLTPKSFFNFSTVVTSYQYADDWESWIYSDGRLAFRVNAPTAIYPGLVVDTEVVVAISWDNNGGTVTQQSGYGGVWGATNTAVWITPPALGLNLQAGHENNNFGDNVYSDVIVFDKVLSDAELLNATNNFDDFYVVDNGILLTPSTINSSGVALNPTIQYSSLLQLSPATINSSSISLDPVIEFSSILTIAPNAINSSSTSLNPAILFSGSLNMSPVTIDSLSITLRPSLNYGKVQTIGTVTAGFADDKYSVKYKLSGITVNFKE